MPGDFSRVTRQDARPLGDELAGVTLARRWYAPDVQMPPHSHRTGAISFVLGGSVQEWGESAGSSRRCEARFGASVVKPAGALHSNRFGPRGAQLLSVEFSDRAAGSETDSAAALARNLLESPVCYGWSAHHLHALTGLRLLAALAGPQQEMPAAVITALRDLQRRLQRVLRCLDQHEGAPPPWISAAVKVLHSPAGMQLRVRDLGRQLGVHPVSLARGFRRVHGCGVVQYRRRLQIMQAARYLAETSQPACAAATACGFADQAHLCRLFRREIGLTPGRFRSLVCDSAN